MNCTLVIFVLTDSSARSTDFNFIVLSKLFVLAQEQIGNFRNAILDLLEFTAA